MAGVQPSLAAARLPHVPDRAHVQSRPHDALNPHAVRAPAIEPVEHDDVAGLGRWLSGTALEAEWLGGGVGVMLDDAVFDLDGHAMHPQGTALDARPTPRWS